MAQEREFTAEKVDYPERVQAETRQTAAQSRIAKSAYGSRREGIAEPLRLSDKDPVLLDLIKTKFVGYFRWTAFAMLLAPVVFWIASRR